MADPSSSSSLSSVSSSDEIEREMRRLGLASSEDLAAEQEAPSTGGYRFTNKAEVQDQRRAIWDFVKEVGLSLLEGKDLVSVSLPVYIFEPRSFLERITDLWTHQHIFLTAAARTTNPIEKMKLVVAFAVSGLHLTCVCRKPFNPILGETLQARFPNGAIVFCEQCSHHPPISRFEVDGPNHEYVMHGSAGYSASLRGNSIKGFQSGIHEIVFSDGTAIAFVMPYMWLSGIMWGDRVMDYTGKMEFEDRKNGLRCELVFNPDSKSWWRSLFSKPSTPSDTVRGQIVTYEFYAGPKISYEDRKEIEERMNNSSTMTVHGTLEGSWLTHLDWAREGQSKKERVWDIHRDRNESIVPIDTPLPSDSRYREDLMHLKKGDLEESKRWKVILEERQRYEARLRKQFAGKQRHDSSEE